MSSFTTMCPILHFLLFLNLCNSSYAIVVLSVITLFGAKAVWASDIIFGKIVLTLLANTLETSLLITLLRLIGQKSDMDWGFLFFGMSSMWVKFIFLRKCPEFKTDTIALVTSLPTICQNFWKKKGDKPLGPDNFEGCIWNRALCTSSPLNGMSKVRFMSSLTTASTDYIMSSIMFGFEVENRLAKYLSTTPDTSSTPDLHIPSSSNNPSIWFFLFLWEDLLWKILVFLSPAESHLALEHCRQKEFLLLH